MVIQFLQPTVMCDTLAIHVQWKVSFFHLTVHAQRRARVEGDKEDSERTKEWEDERIEEEEARPKAHFI